MSINDRDWWTLEAMRRRGGSFVRALAEAAHRADDVNLNKMKEAWPEYFAEYEAHGAALEKDHAGDAAASMSKQPDFFDDVGNRILRWIETYRSRGLMIFANGEGEAIDEGLIREDIKKLSQEIGRIVGV